MGQNEIYSIRQMVELTGLSEFTIRGWENRYSAFDPKRSETGRREYRKSDIEKALLLRELLKRGFKIGKIAPLTPGKLLNLFENNEAQQDCHRETPLAKFISEALEAVALQKWPELESLLRKIPETDSSHLIRDFFLPVLQEFALKIEAGLISIAQEHIFSSFLKEKIYSSLSQLPHQARSTLKKGQSRFVLAGPEGDYHEIGLLLAHLMIRSRGRASLYLGAHTPSQELSETALRFNASHILIVSTVSKSAGARRDLLAYVHEVQKVIAPTSQIIVAGPQARRLPSLPDRQIHSLQSFDDLDSFLSHPKGSL